ncbi:MAG: hypothetical protein Q7T49_02940 [bacterium]|nr:hypothetical protein [bacterium]
MGAKAPGRKEMAMTTVEQAFLLSLGLNVIEKMTPQERIEFYRQRLEAEVSKPNTGTFQFLLQQLLQEEYSLEESISRETLKAEKSKPFDERTPNMPIDIQERYASRVLPYLEQLYLLVWKNETQVCESYLLTIIYEIGKFWVPQWPDNKYPHQAFELLLSIYGYPVWSEAGREKFSFAKVSNDTKNNVEEAVKKVFREAGLRAEQAPIWIGRIALSPELVKIFFHPLLSELDTGFSLAVVEFLPALRVFAQGYNQRNNAPMADRRRSIMSVLNSQSADRSKRLINAQESLERVSNYPAGGDIRITSKQVDWLSSSKAVIKLQVHGEGEEFQIYIEHLRRGLNQWRCEYGELQIDGFVNEVKLEMGC